MIVNWLFILSDWLFRRKYCFPSVSLEYHRRKRQLRYVVYTPQWSPKSAEEIRNAYLWHKEEIDHTPTGDEYYGEFLVTVVENHLEPIKHLNGVGP